MKDESQDGGARKLTFQQAGIYQIDAVLGIDNILLRRTITITVG